MDQATQDKNVQEALKSAQAAPAGVKTEDWNPMEDIPTVSAGGQWAQGTTLKGHFLETQRLVSNKFDNSKEIDPVTGKKVGYRHILKLADGKKLGIWTSGELKMTFEKVNPGEYIEITYVGKGKNSQNQDQHFFKYKKGAQQH
jgi:hypothetical protein